MLTGWTRIPLLDEPQIEMIRAALGDDDFRVMYAEFPRAARKAAGSIEMALRRSNIDQARAAAHGMNGVASSFGAERLARLASFIELEADSLTAVSQLIDVLTETINATDSILRKERQAIEV
jgi:HPt (histidine-containing phosphotransfer) domain-containing protein